jgi:polysaccharide biosynthesis protein PslJ
VTSARVAAPRKQSAAVPLTVFLGTIVALAAAVATGSGVKPLLGLTVLISAFLVYHRMLLAWRALLTATIAIILFIPIRRYALPGHLPFQLEPYRLLIAFVVVLWIGALLIDPRVRLIRSNIDRPMAAIFLVAVASIGANYSRISDQHVVSDSIKQLTFLGSFLLIVLLIVGLVRRREDVNRLLSVLVAGGAAVALSAIIELYTHYNVFNHVQALLPFLHETTAPVEAVRAGHIRVLASSQHPIALGAMFVMLVPIAVYLIRETGRRIWALAILLCILGALATASRTAVVMLFVIAIVYLCLRPRQTVRVWPALIPMLLLVHVAMPGVVGGFYKAFFPKGGLVAEQGGAPVGSSRIASLGPGLHQIGLRPLVGAGYGSRILQDQANANSFIVDDQWLSTGMDTGILGVGAWLWLFIRFLRPTYRAARRDRGADGWLYAGIAASITSFAVGMLTFDAFSFIQTTFVLFFLLGLGSVALSLRTETV